jgi:putative DNA primase/helicase
LSANREAALAYARLSLAVFPLVPGDKLPLISKDDGGKGVHDATSDVAQIEAWWTRWPNANIGLACGASCWVLDADYAGWLTDKPDGADTISALRRRFGPLPATVRQYTGGMGWQWLFKPDARIKNGSRFLPGLDTRAAGGYIVVPPSLHPSGRHYHWIAAPKDAELATAPAWLLSLLEPVAEPEPEAPRPIKAGDLSRYAAVALERACERVAGCPPGNQADALDHAAYSIGRLVGGGVIPLGEARSALIAAGANMPNQGGRKPWSRGEIAWRVDRALASGARSPRAPEGRQ